MRILIDEDRLQARVSEMALEIDKYYLGQDWYQKSQEPVIVIGVLTGSIFFMADLVRKLSIRTELDFIKVSTYPNKSIIAKKPKIISLLTKSLSGANILLIDDILDTGKTISTIRKYFWDSWIFPENIRIAVLLRKPGKAPADVTADFVGFDIPDEFVFGYGLNYGGRHRELPYVAVRGENEFETSKSKTG